MRTMVRNDNSADNQQDDGRTSDGSQGHQF